ncbi:hypothetical protein [Nocardia sp. CNY236]|uniref:hypothetical protein n=1 Tax=Nocardia sp. CNY236 TaxID=1169152 RepID=UPI0012DEE8B3|nr:hypothetical protein [Nocardia sp. CNY236]
MAGFPHQIILRCVDNHDEWGNEHREPVNNTAWQELIDERLDYRCRPESLYDKTIHHDHEYFKIGGNTMRKSFGHKGLMGIIAISSLTAATLAAAPSVAAAPNPPGEELCTINYLTPDDFTVHASTKVFVTQDGDGSIDVIARTNAQSETPYSQQFSVVWSNLDTGLSGVDNVTAVVQGRRNILSIPDIPTEPGRIPLVLGVSNTGTNPNHVTSGDCGALYVVR